MTRLRVLFNIVFALLLVAACAPMPTATPDAPSTPPGAPPEPSFAQAQTVLAGRLGLTSEAITVISTEPVDWPNACLGLAAADELCAEVITPGYRIVLEAAGQRYTVHTDLSGEQARLAEPNSAPAPSPAAIAAQRVLAEQLGTELSTIQVVSVEPTQWRDGCLELGAPDEMCTMAIVPGYRVTLAVAGQQYVLHTDESGSQVRATGLSAPENVWPAPTLAVRATLASELNLPQREIRLVSVEPAQWPDACLGIPLPDEACAQVTTPGYKFVLEAQGQQYAYHTDLTGKVIRGLPAPIAAPSGAVSDESAIYSAVIRELYTVDHTFDVAPEFPVLYLVNRTDDGVGGGNETAQASQPITEPIQQAIESLLLNPGPGSQPLPARLVWIADPEQAPRDAQGSIAEGGAIITLGNIRPQPDGSVHVAASIYIGMLAAGGQTYVLEQQGGAWRVTGKTGLIWIS